MEPGALGTPFAIGEERAWEINGLVDHWSYVLALILELSNPVFTLRSYPEMYNLYGNLKISQVDYSTRNFK